MNTHKYLSDPDLRHIYANELLVLRRVHKASGQDIHTDWMNGICLGIETALRRVEMHKQHGDKMLSDLNKLTGATQKESIC